MPTYSALALEAVWRAQYVPSVLDTVLVKPLRTFYNLGPTSIGAPGDNNHLYGRHRSANWDRQSIYCTNRSYGTTDARDKQGDQDWYRACDIGITGQTLYDASHRIDAVVRSGGAPGVAEWFGTFDGKTVVGWYEGHASSSDSSHLYHLHVGLWNQYANDPATVRAVYGAITGTGDDMTPEEHNLLTSNANRIQHGILDGDDVMNDTPGYNTNRPVWIVGAIKALDAKLDQVLAALAAGTTVDISDEQVAEIADAAKEGAEAGAPTEAELEQAAFEGAQRAEDE